MCAYHREQHIVHELVYAPLHFGQPLVIGCPPSKPLTQRLDDRGPKQKERLRRVFAAQACSRRTMAVLDRYFARHVSINSFTETVLRSESRGEINRWGQQWGARPTL